MSVQDRLPDLLMFYPPLRDAAEEHRDAIASESRLATAPVGQHLFAQGDICGGLLLVIAGEFRVVRKPPGNGRGLLLYRVRPGELCVQSVCGMLGGGRCVAAGIVEHELTGVLVPTPLFRRLVDESPPIREMVFGNLASRFTGILQTVEDLAFSRLEQRLAKRLSNEPAPLSITHQALAEELGSAREVISRLLKDFENQGIVNLRRGEIEIANQAALRDLSGPAPAQ